MKNVINVVINIVAVVFLLFCMRNFPACNGVVYNFTGAGVLAAAVKVALMVMFDVEKVEAATPSATHAPAASEPEKDLVKFYGVFELIISKKEVMVIDFVNGQEDIEVLPSSEDFYNEALGQRLFLDEVDDTIEEEVTSYLFGKAKDLANKMQADEKKVNLLK